MFMHPRERGRDVVAVTVMGMWWQPLGGDHTADTAHTAHTARRLTVLAPSSVGCKQWVAAR